tara:strand:- start:447 stop:662 length:216 start_codon:yes stop_codon:yes gene_type:complete
MSDSIKKWHEMQEDKKIYESPDGGKTVFERPLRVPNGLTDDEKKEAYKLLAYYDTKVILYAASIINNESTS